MPNLHTYDNNKNDKDKTQEVPQMTLTEEVDELWNRIVRHHTGEEGALLRATTGKASCKILVDDSFTVVEERHGIADANRNFHMYVQGYWDTETQGWWWREGSAQ